MEGKHDWNFSSQLAQRLPSVLRRGRARLGRMRRGRPWAEAADQAAKHTWEVKPEPIAADQIAQTVDAEVLVIGGGYSGSC